MSDKLSAQLVMTPQLQMAIKLLATRSAELPEMFERWRADHPGTLELLAPGEPDPFVTNERAKAPDDEPPPSFPLDEPPLPDLGGLPPDVWIFGNPPQVHANGRAFPRMKVTTGLADAMWVVRALFQRARSYERVVASAVALRPQLAIALEPGALAPLSVRELAEHVGFHESTVTRIASACTFQNLHAVLQFDPKKSKLGFRAR